MQLLNFILYDFLKSPLFTLVVFNCWDAATLYKFSQLTASHSFHVQFVNLNRTDSTIYTVQRFLNHKAPKLGVFLDLNCRHTNKVVEIISRYCRFNVNYHWLLYDDAANLSNFRQQFAAVNLSIDADLSYAVPSSKLAVQSTTYYTLYDVYNNGKQIGGRLNMTIDREIACNNSACQIERYLSELYLRHKYHNRPTMIDVNLRVSTVVTSRPLTTATNELVEFLSTTDHVIVDNIARFGFVTIRLMKDLLQCNMTYIFRQSWSDTDHHGGIVGDLVDEVADIASSPFLITEGRLHHMHPLRPASQFRSVCVFRTPRNSGIKGNALLAPFSTTVWILFIMVVLLFAILLWFIFIVEYHSMRQQLYYAPSLLTTIVLSFGTACIQGSFLVPFSAGGRIAFFTLTLVCFLMYNYYTSIVVSSLLGAPIKSNIKSIQQLADSSLTVLMEPLPYTAAYLKTQPLPEIKHFVERKVKPLKNMQDIWMPVETGVLQVRDTENFVYVFEASTGYVLVERFFTAHQICDLNEIGFRVGTLFIQVHQNSSYKDFFRLKLLRIAETGLHQKHYKYWTRSKPTCYSNNVVIDVGLEYTAPLFILLCCIYMLVILILFLEIIHKKYQNAN